MNLLFCDLLSIHIRFNKIKRIGFIINYLFYLSYLQDPIIELTYFSYCNSMILPQVEAVVVRGIVFKVHRWRQCGHFVTVYRIVIKKALDLSDAKVQAEQNRKA